jgi:hypothetical protein
MWIDDDELRRRSPGPNQAIPLHNGNNGGPLAGGAVDKYGAPKDAANTTGDGKAGAGQGKRRAWFRKNSGSGAGEGRPHSGSEEPRAGDVDATKAKQQQNQQQQHQQTDNQRAQSRMSAGGGDVMAEQDEGGGGRKRKSSGSGKMGGFFKLFGKRDSWKQSTEDAQLSLGGKYWQKNFFPGFPFFFILCATTDLIVEKQAQTWMIRQACARLTGRCTSTAALRGSSGGARSARFRRRRRWRSGSNGSNSSC